MLSSSCPWGAWWIASDHAKFFRLDSASGHWLKFFAAYAGDMAVELAHERTFKRTRPLRESLKMSREYVRKTMR
jgi:hypothetical protein